MLLNEVREDDGLDEYDRVRASDMDECRPIYSAIDRNGKAVTETPPASVGIQEAATPLAMAAMDAIGSPLSGEQEV